MSTMSEITYSAKRCRAERGQVIAVCDGVVKDLTNLPPDEQEKMLARAVQGLFIVDRYEGIRANSRL